MKWWPFSKNEPEREKRSSGGDFSDAVVRRLEAVAANQVADAASTAAVEAASGALSRAFSSAEVQGPSWARDAVTRLNFSGRSGATSYARAIVCTLLTMRIGCL